MSFLPRSRQASTQHTASAPWPWLLLCLSLVCMVGVAQQGSANSASVVGDRADSAALFLAGPVSLPELPRWRQASAAIDGPCADNEPDIPAVWLPGPGGLLLVVPVVVPLPLAPAGAFIACTRVLAGSPRGPPVLPVFDRQQPGVV